MVLSMFRLIPIVHGTIFIDDVDIRSIRAPPFPSFSRSLSFSSSSPPFL